MREETIIRKLNALHAAIVENPYLDDDDMPKFCRKHGFKFLGIGSARCTVKLADRCFKLQYRDSEQNSNELDFADKIRLTEFHSNFALALKKINDNIIEVEYFDGFDLSQIYYKKGANFYYDIFDKVKKVTDQLRKENIFLYDISSANVLYNPRNKQFKIVDYAF